MLNNLDFLYPDATPITFITEINNKEIWLKHDYKNHIDVSGNKLRKLKYNVIDALANKNTLVSFGGAHSNHIAALSAIGELCNIKTVGIIRGDELANSDKWSNTLKKAKLNGMNLHFINRTLYRNKSSLPIEIKEIINGYQCAKLIPEGGSNKLSLLGTSEVISEIKNQINCNKIFAACGSGGTISGLIDGCFKYNYNAEIIGVPVLKINLQGFIKELSDYSNKVKWDLKLDYHFGGYAKTTEDILDFMKEFEQENNILLDPIYTAKLCFSVFDLARKSETNKEIWVIYHSGGLQGR